jgi:hypothetical protein
MLNTSNKPEQKIKLRLYTPHSGQLRIHRSKARFRIVCCGRRFGKTYLACNEAIKFAADHPNTLTAWITPSYKQSKIAFRLIKRALKDVAVTNNSELRIELPNGSIIAFYSAENYDALRGNGFAFVIMDESADIRPEAWSEVIRPAISDTRGRVLMIGTPKGRNFFYTLFCRGEDPAYPDWQSFSAPTSANPYIHPSEIAAAKKELPEDTFEQEYLAVFKEDGAGVFRGIDACISGDYDEDGEEPISSHQYFMGWDPAKHQDYSVMTVIDAYTMNVVHWYRTNQVDYTVQLQEVEHIALRYDAYVLMDQTGVGSPLLERLKQRELACDGYLFTNASKKTLIEHLQLGIQHKSLSFPKIEILINELRQYEYQRTPSGLITYNAPDGAHDDAVISLALAYYASAKPNVPLQGDTVDETSIEVPTIKEIVTYDPFAWADEHGGW